ncbi:purine-nucleoside phosphorylase [Alsobacter sp. SYSU M60028]|uniref:Purine nucleoside phosphorylase n=1 Tax=Alsobacter ponti TaxID=2962936 RepID=A0ABT1L9H1_9HYPH|nr:purine-nucleoside phosphorylase [Alsobacter ponti]MCP8938094.1 purine-nucleoside phosphorylase [Alsobacter ponti]
MTPAHDQAALDARCEDAVARLAPLLGRVSVGLVLGTGLGAVADAVEDKVVVPYADIPGFPENSVSGHAGRIVAGTLAGRRVAVMQGRAHYYETADSAAMRVPLETLRRLGAGTLVLTNAAGSLRPDLAPGRLCLLTDHLNLSGTNPLLGDRGDGRFVSMTDAYDPGLRRAFHAAARASGVDLDEGVYCWVSGPSFETPAEIRMLRILGGDVVGMSTVPEVILARRLGLRVAAVSTVTNFGAGIENASPSHHETKDVAAKAGAALSRLLIAFLGGLDDA